MKPNAITWDQFVQALAAYRDAEFVGRSPIDGERAYLALYQELACKRRLKRRTPPA